MAVSHAVYFIAVLIVPAGGNGFVFDGQREKIALFPRVLYAEIPGRSVRSVQQKNAACPEIEIPFRDAVFGENRAYAVRRISFRDTA